MKWLNAAGSGRGALEMVRGMESCQAGSTYQLQLLGNGSTCSKFEYECGKTGTKGEKLEMGCVRGDWLEVRRPKSGKRLSTGMREWMRCCSGCVVDGGKEHLSGQNRAGQ